MDNEMIIKTHDTHRFKILRWKYMSNLNIPSTRVLSSPLKKGRKKAPVIKQNSMSINYSKLWEKQSQKNFTNTIMQQKVASNITQNSRTLRISL